MIQAPSYSDLVAEIRNLKARIAYLERQLYGAKPDRLSRKNKQKADQSDLFDKEFKDAYEDKHKEIEKTVKDIEAETAKRKAQAEKTKPSRPSSYRYEGLEERVFVIEPENINPEDYEKIGEDVQRILHYVPAQLWVEVIKRPIYRLKADKNALKPHICQAEAPNSVIGGGHVAADMLAQIVIDKFRDHLPEYRQVKRYEDLGMKLPTSTLNNWVHAVANRLAPLYEAQRRDIRESDYLQVDEVPWRIADRPGASRKGYTWQFLDSRPDPHGLYFFYLSGSRAGYVPRAELKDFHGAIQSDGYKVYDYFEEQENVTLLGCMAHVRRKFIDAQKSAPEDAAKAVEWIGLLYKLEENLRQSKATFEEKAEARRTKALPIMDAIEAWMQMISKKYTPSDSMGRALEYAYKLWPRLRRYALDGRYHIDNNPVERGQRPTVMGRKNYLFNKTDQSAVDHTYLYTLIESCDVVGVEPLPWLKYVLENLHDDTPPEQIKQMLPYYYKKSHG